MNTKETIETFLKLIGVKGTPSLIVAMSSLVKLAPLLEKNLPILSCGHQAEGKSVLYPHLNADIICEPITSSQLRGNARNGSEDKEIPFFLREVCVFEECTSITKEVGAEFKNLFSSEYFNLNKKENTRSPLSCIFVGNSYSDIKENKDFTLESILSGFPAAITDRAFLSKLGGIVPHFSKFLGDRSYTDDFSDLKNKAEHYSKLRDIKFSLISFDINEDFNERSKLLIKKLTFGIIKILYGEEVPPLHIANGIVEYASFFHSLALGKFYNPINTKSINFILEAIHGSIDDIEFVILYENRILVKLFNKNICLKYALNGFGVNENLSEIEFYKNLPESNIIAKITKCEHKGGVLHQEFNFSPLTSKVIYFKRHPNKIVTDDSFNSLILNSISNGVYNNLPEFRGIPSTTLSNIKYRINKELNFNLTEIKKSNICISNKGFQLVTFQEYIKK